MSENFDNSRAKKKEAEAPLPQPPPRAVFLYLVVLFRVFPHADRHPRQRRSRHTRSHNSTQGSTRKFTLKRSPHFAFSVKSYYSYVHFLYLHKLFLTDYYTTNPRHNKPTTQSQHWSDGQASSTHQTQTQGQSWSKAPKPTPPTTLIGIFSHNFSLRQKHVVGTPPAQRGGGFSNTLDTSSLTITLFPRLTRGHSSHFLTGYLAGSLAK